MSERKKERERERERERIELNMFTHVPFGDLYGDQLIVATMRQITYLINNFSSS